MSLEHQIYGTSLVFLDVLEHDKRDRCEGFQGLVEEVAEPGEAPFLLSDVQLRQKVALEVVDAGEVFAVD